MGKGGRKSMLCNKNPKFSPIKLVLPEQENKIVENKLSFSFAYFNHNLDNFQLGNCKNNWFVGLIERLNTLSKLSKDEVLKENAGSKALRCHEIDWTIKNIPIQRKDLDWLPDKILSNDQEFPIMQLSISNGTGRIVGFFDSNPQTFHIILLDPHHNIQPCKKTNYQIQPTTQGISQYDELLNKLEKIKSIITACTDKKCLLHSHIDYIEGLHDNILYMGLDKRLYDDYHEVLKKYTLTEILERGIIECI